TWLSLVEHSLGVRGVGSATLPVPTIFVPGTRSLATLGISPAGSRFAHACKAAQVQICPSRPFSFLELDPSLRSGFRLQAPASLTPAKRLKFKSARPDHSLNSGFRAAGQPLANSCSLLGVSQKESTAGLILVARPIRELKATTREHSPDSLQDEELDYSPGFPGYHVHRGYRQAGRGTVALARSSEANADTDTPGCARVCPAALFLF